MYYLLGLHIALGSLLVIAVITRFIAVITKKIDPKTGRLFVVGLGSGLIASGVALVLVAKSGLTAACAFSLVIVAAVITYELGLEFFAKKVTVKNK